MSKRFVKYIKEWTNDFEASKTKEGKEIVKGLINSYKYEDAITFAQKVAIGMNKLRMLEMDLIDEEDLEILEK